MAIKQHVIKKGETLSGIVTKYYGKFDANILNMVMATNHISNPDKIREGVTLNLQGNWGGASPVKPEITDIKHSESKISALVSQTKPSDTPSYKTNVKAAEIVMKEKALKPSDYWKELYHKNLIILHFTTGYTFDGAYSTFLGTGRVATPFVVDNDGTIYRLFDERYWAYHIGVKGKDSENSFHEKRSIGIEIVNPGPLWYKNGKWLDWWGLTSKKGRVYKESEVVVGKNRDADGMSKSVPRLTPHARSSTGCSLSMAFAEAFPRTSVRSSCPPCAASKALPHIRCSAATSTTSARHSHSKR